MRQYLDTQSESSCDHVDEHTVPTGRWQWGLTEQRLRLLRVIPSLLGSQHGFHTTHLEPIWPRCSRQVRREASHEIWNRQRGFCGTSGTWKIKSVLKLPTNHTAGAKSTHFPNLAHVPSHVSPWQRFLPPEYVVPMAITTLQDKIQRVPERKGNARIKGSHSKEHVTDHQREDAHV